MTISLLSYFENNFENILCKGLISFKKLMEYIIIILCYYILLYYCRQFGFRKDYSTGTVLTEIIDYIKPLFDEKK